MIDRNRQPPEAFPPELNPGGNAPAGAAVDLVWKPTPRAVEAARISDFAGWVARTRGIAADTYDQLWQWSVTDVESFWLAVSEYFGVVWAKRPDRALTPGQMPGVEWFPGGQTNYVSQVFRDHRDGPAIMAADASGAMYTVTWAELRRQVAALAATLRERGVGVGDRVVGYLPDVAEGVIAFLATASVGAVWAGCGQDLSPSAVIDRFAQLEPSVLVTATGYYHRGKLLDRTDEVNVVSRGLTSLHTTIVVARHPDVAERHSAEGYVDWSDATDGAPELDIVAVPSDHPLWVLFSSGTTGLPKGIVHSHAGVLVEHLKTVALHLDVSEGDRFFWYTTLTWMMWNLRNSGLLVGASIVCFDGTPAGDVLWRLAAEHGITTLGLSPGYLAACRKEKQHPADDHDLRALRTVGCTGSVLAPDLHSWIAAELGPDVLVASTTGGTDIVSGLAGAVPTVPIVAGEISVRCLGVGIEAWDAEGHPVVGMVGDLVVTTPMPSMPVWFWNDVDGSRYRDAYFDHFPGIWRHGDWITVTGRGSVIVHGRSDATLNRNGVRMGTSDIYRAVEALEGVAEALVIGVEEPDGGYWMPLFVTLSTGAELDDDLQESIISTIRNEVSPRHVPDQIIAAPGIPHTLTGKKIEIPLKRILLGHPTAAIQPGVLDRPELLDWYAAMGGERRQHRM